MSRGVQSGIILSMDESTQKSQTSQVQTNQVMDDSGATAQPVQTSVPPVQPVIQKEQEGLPASEFIKPSFEEPVLHPEVAEAGVEKVSELPGINEEHEQIGVKLAKESTPVSKEPSGIIQLPSTYQKAQQVMKTHKKVSDSILWLYTLIIKQFKGKEREGL